MGTGVVILQVSKLLERVTERVAALVQDALFAAMNETNTFFKSRIFDNGKASDGSDIGDYSDERIYVPREVFYFKQPSGGFKETKGGNLRFDEGWKAVRKSVGRQTNKVDLIFGGSLFLSVQVVVLSASEISIGITDEENAKKSKGNEKHFQKDIFKMNEEEITFFKKAVVDYFNIHISQITNDR